MASIDWRIEDLERRFASDSDDGDEGKQIRRRFMHDTMDAMASIKHAPLDEPPWGYNIDKLRGMDAFGEAVHAAALTVMEH